MILFFRMILLLLTLGGFSFFLKEKWDIRLEFIPAILCCGISSIMFMAGILNIFSLTTICITVVGVFLFIFFSLSRKRKIIFAKRQIIIAFIWLLLLSSFALLIKGSHFIGYDNFSHWVAVIKSMLINDRLPNFQDKLITFQAYPLGSSVFIYYVCKIIGNSDACYMFGQIILIISFIMPLMAFIKKENFLFSLCIPLFFVFSLICNISIYDLLVDTVMPLAALALFCLIKIEFKNPNQFSINRLFVLMVPLNIFLLQVKNSGIFFCIVGWMYCIYKMLVLDNDNIKKKLGLLKFFLLDIVIPLFTLFLWKQHVKLVFDAGNKSKHALSIYNFKSNLSLKSHEDMLKIFRLIIERLKNVHDISFIILMVISAAFLVLIILNIINKDKKGLMKHIFELMFIYFIFFTYTFSVYSMYIFSMPLGEALNLDGFSRYMVTIDIFLLGIAVTNIFDEEKNKNIFFSLVLILLIACPIIPLRDNVYNKMIQEDYKTTARYKFNRIIKENRVESYGKYLIYSNINDAGYLLFLSRFDLWSDNIIICNGQDFSNYLNNSNLFDYIIIYTPDEVSNKCLQGIGLSQYANSKQVVIQKSHLKLLN